MSKINVNTVDTQCGSTLTLGSSGKTVTLASGASQSGFGRTGTVDWCTTAKTTPLTVASGNGYFINTTGGAITVTFPGSPSAGDIVAFKDYANTWDTNAVTIGRNGSKINGICSCGNLNTESQSVTLIYVDGTKGWQDIHDSTANVQGATFISATGGTVTTSGNFKIHTFNSDATFCVSAVGNPAGSVTVDYLVVGGGGSAGGGETAGGGGAGGYRESSGAASGCYSRSPLGACVSALPVSVQSYPITIGGGGAAPSGKAIGINGSNSTFSTITSAGGGGGGYDNCSPPDFPGLAGGSGGGGTGLSGRGGLGGAGNTPSVSPPQGNNGGQGSTSSGNENGSGGGGGATSVGAGNQSPGGGPGGNGATSSITGSPVTRAGGGGGGLFGPGPVGAAGPGGGGVGGRASPNSNGAAGTANTGGGGGSEGGPNTSSGNAGGSGVVIIRYKFQ
jgi:hypothetical protein